MESPDGHGTGLTTSCGIVSLLQLKSPVRHSPKAIVFDVPSVMSGIEIGRGRAIHDGQQPVGSKSDANKPVGLLFDCQSIDGPTEAK